MQLVHAVRRFGPVGGMERYVWELTRNLRDLGFKVIVLCEVCLAEKPQGIEVHELGAIKPRPRWVSSFRFSDLVDAWLEKNPDSQRLIHSNERLKCHQITTVHGAPFTTVFEKPWWRLISIRVWMQLFLERRELVTAQYIVPNSDFIKQQLVYYYPNLASKFTDPIIPGVVNIVERMQRIVAHDGGVIGFVGREWKRKGLRLAIKIVAELKINRPNLEFHVIGPDPNEIKHLFAEWNGGYKLTGWSDQQHFTNFDVLLHPAKAEPYGMVITEAMAACVPVVISDVCGAAAQVGRSSGKVLSLSAPIKYWVNALEKELNRNDPVPKFVRPWRNVAEEFVQIYESYFESKSTSI